jgi:Carboxypeptidase regulatory-like domain
VRAINYGTQRLRLPAKDLSPASTCAKVQANLTPRRGLKLDEGKGARCKLEDVQPNWIAAHDHPSWPCAQSPPRATGALLCLCLATLLFSIPSRAQLQPSAPASTSLNVSSASTVCGITSQSDQQRPGSVSGTVVDPEGNGLTGAQVALAREDKSSSQEALAQDDGQFSFTNVPPGPFHLTVNATGFAAQSIAGNLGSGESCVVPRITLAVATNVTEVRVELTPIELAQEQLKDQEKQRLFGVIPNFYVSYTPHAMPLTSKQKFQLAWKSTVDPVSFGVTGAVAGVEQATGTLEGYGQGAQGYAKRYGAAYADLVTGTFIGGAIFPSLLKQDPRYFYKGTGSVRSRVLYAISMSVICRGDNGHWQPNYSGIMGSLASGGISNLYYPASDRSDAALTFENMVIGIGETAAVNLLQEFVMRKLTPNVPNYGAPSTP